MATAETLTLDNGLRVVIQHIPTANSVSIGIFSQVGLLQEPEECSGIAHFLEHMSFKGTEKRSAKQITESVDNIGGVINAHTGKENTNYYITVLPHCVPDAMDILFDLYLNSVCAQSDIDMERQIVLEEISMYEDTPDENIHDLFSGTIWSKGKLGRSILGSAKSLETIDRKAVLAFKKHYLNPKNIVISVAGRIENKKEIRRTIESAFKLSVPKISPFSAYLETPKSHADVKIIPKKTEQVHFCLGTQGVAFNHPDHYKITLLATLLGGSMSSRLFQKIREEKGWAYSVYAYVSFYMQSGLFTIYAGVNKDHFLPSFKVMLDEFKTVQDKVISATELRKVKEQLKGNLILSLERSASWMNWIGRSIIYFDRVQTVEEVIENIEAVTANDLQSIAQQILNPDMLALAAVGPFDKAVESPMPIQSFLAENKRGLVTH